MNLSTDRIEKKIVLRAPQQRVWNAIANAKKFGAWFGVEFDGEFVAGERIVGTLTPTTVDEEVAKRQEAYAGMAFEFHVDRIEPMRLFSYRWHPFAIDTDNDYSKEPMTLVSFELEAVADGTMSTIAETGFDGIPLARRADAFEANEEGWGAQSQMLEKYLAISGT